jgi:AcrR family transcriptional regulator
VAEKLANSIGVSFDEVRIHEIAEASGIPPSTLHYHLPRKDGIPVAHGGVRVDETMATLAPLLWRGVALADSDQWSGEPIVPAQGITGGWLGPG